VVAVEARVALAVIKTAELAQYQQLQELQLIMQVEAAAPMSPHSAELAVARVDLEVAHLQLLATLQQITAQQTQAVAVAISTDIM
jgi:hypothetical protein